MRYLAAVLMLLAAHFSLTAFAPTPAAVGGPL
jgi:hypothetical protein